MMLAIVKLRSLSAPQHRRAGAVRSQIVDLVAHRDQRPSRRASARGSASPVAAGHTVLQAKAP